MVEKPLNQRLHFHKNKFLRTILTAFFLCLFIALAIFFTFRGTLRNSYALFSKNPTEYYHYVEKRNLSKATDYLSLYQNLSPKKSAYDISTEVSFYRDALDSILQSGFGLSFKELERTLGVPIETVGLETQIRQKDSLINDTFSISLNKVNLITLEAFANSTKQDLYLRLPELSPAYLRPAFTIKGKDLNSSMVLLKLLTSDYSANSIKRYGNLIIDDMDQVSLEKNVTLALDDLSIECNKLTVSFTKEELYSITMELLEKAKTDSELLSILSELEVSPEEYLNALENIKTYLASFYTTHSYNSSFQMLLYIDDYGRILSREFQKVGSEASLNYVLLSKKNNSEYCLTLKNENGTMLFRVTGNQTKVQRAYNGALSLEYNCPNSNENSASYINITYKDVHFEFKKSHFYQYGTYTLSAPELMGIHAEMENSVESELQKNKLTIRMGASPLVIFDTKVIFPTADIVSMPSKKAQIFDTSQFEDYVNTLRTEDYLDELSEQLGVNKQNLEDLYSNQQSHGK